VDGTGCEYGTCVRHLIVIGAMKAGTTTLHRWLDEQPEISMSDWKEPSFFSRDDRWDRGCAWYESLFDATGPHTWVGESSTSYSRPAWSERAAERIARIRPHATLVYLLRDPVERTRSHYRHQVQRGRERRPFLEALADPHTDYLSASRYWACLEPYVARFDRTQLVVTLSEDLFGGDDAAWDLLLDRLGLPPRERPSGVHNVTAGKPRDTLVLRELRKRPNTLKLIRSLPRPIRRLGRSALTDDDHDYRSLLASSHQPVPSELVHEVWADVQRLEDWLGRERPFWTAVDAS
jgi:hypothetical protein